MKKLIPFLVFSLLSVANNAFSQSPYFFKSTDVLKAEKDAALQSSQYTVSNEITKELTTRNETQAKIDLLQSDINKKLEVEDYVAAQSLKDQMDKLKADQAKAEDLRKKIEAALAIEDYEKADQYKTALLSLSNPSSAPATQQAQIVQQPASTNSGFSSVTTNTNTNSNQQLINSLSATGNGLAGFSSNAAPVQSNQYGQSSYEDLMRKSKSYKRRGVFSIIFGPICLASGTVLLISGLNYTTTEYDYVYGYSYETSDPNVPMIVSGAMLDVLGIIFTTAVTPTMFYKARKYKKQANGLANTSFVPMIKPMYNNVNQSWGINAGVGFKCNF
jgi:hypothetical protein